MNLKLFILKENLENVFHIQYETISPNIIEKVKQILSSNYKYEIRESTFLEHKNYIEIGPKKLFKTSWNTNVLDIFKNSNIFCISNIEFSVKYPKNKVPDYDKMIYEIYDEDEEIVFKPEIAKSFGARLINFKWNGKFPKKRNWTLENVDIKNEWVLFLDADEFLTLAPLLAASAIAFCSA